MALKDDSVNGEIKNVRKYWDKGISAKSFYEKKRNIQKLIKWANL